MAKILIGNIKGEKGDKGDKGDTGASFKISEFFDTYEELAAVENPSAGDAYGVGSNKEYDIYVYSPTKGWVNNGAISLDISERTPEFIEDKASEIDNINIESTMTIREIFGKIKRAISELISHLKNKNNPHEVTASDVGAFPVTGGILNGYLGISAETYPGVEFHSPNNLSRIMRNAGKDENGNEFDYGLILSDFDSEDQAESVSLMLSCKEVLMNASAMTYALRLSSIINGQVKYYNIFGEHNASELGVARIETKTYTGNGLYGVDNARTFTFSFLPRMFFISGYGPGGGNYTLTVPQGFPFVSTVAAASGGDFTTVSCNFKYSGNSITMYNPSSATNGLNIDGSPYSITAIG